MTLVTWTVTLALDGASLSENGHGRLLDELEPVDDDLQALVQTHLDLLPDALRDVLRVTVRRSA